MSPSDWGSRRAGLCLLPQIGAPGGQDRVSPLRLAHRGQELFPPPCFFLQQQGQNPTLFEPSYPSQGLRCRTPNHIRWHVSRIRQTDRHAMRDGRCFQGGEGATYLPPLLVLHPLSIHDAHCGERRKTGLRPQAKRKARAAEGDSSGGGGASGDSDLGPAAGAGAGVGVAGLEKGPRP